MTKMQVHTHYILAKSFSPGTSGLPELKQNCILKRLSFNFTAISIFYINFFPGKVKTNVIKFANKLLFHNTSLMFIYYNPEDCRRKKHDKTLDTIRTTL